MVTSCAFSSDGTQAIAGGFTGEVRLFDVNTFKYNTSFTARSTRGKNAAGQKITSMESFPVPSSGGERLLISSNDSRMRLYHVADKLVEVKYAGHENSSSQLRASFSDDGRYVISGSEDGMVCIWESGMICTGSHGRWHALKRAKDKGPAFEAFHPVPDQSKVVVTCASFAPSLTREVLAQSADPVFGDGRDHLAPLHQTLSGASLAQLETQSTRFVAAAPDGGLPNAALDAIIVASDSESGVLRVYRNSGPRDPHGLLKLVKKARRTSRASEASAGR